jgi:hypothetical protein
VRVLSVKQPWASLIASGRKSIELRRWPTRYRGPVLILAGAGVWRGTDYPIGPRGVAICVVELVDVRAVTAADADAACIEPPAGFGFAWLLSNPRAVQNAPVKGRLGLYTDRSLDWLISNL